MLAVRADSPWNNVQEFVADAKKRSGAITFGSSVAAQAQFAACAAGLKAAGVTHWAAAHVAAILGDADVVFAELNAAGAAGEANFATTAVSPYFAPLHADARWRELIARHRLPRVPASAWISSSDCARDRSARPNDDGVPTPAPCRDC